MAAALNGEDVLMLLSTASGKSWICQVLLFIFSRDTSPIGKGILPLGFIYDWESGIVNLLVL